MSDIILGQLIDGPSLRADVPTLVRLGFVYYPTPGQVAATGLLFLEGAA